jgi:hypothetical protein
MFVDLWIVALFSLLFGGCAWWNYRKGVTDGITTTLNVLLDDKVIDVIGDKIVPHKEPNKRRRKNV